MRDGIGAPRLFLLALAIGAFAVAYAASPGSEPPKLHGQTLDGHAVVLPDASAGKVTLLVIGASRKGGDQAGPWRDHFAADFGSNPNASYYVAALLQSAPSLVRGMIRSSMRSATPVDKRPHVLTASSDEAAWKSYLELKDDSLPGVVLLDQTGHLLWIYTGVFDPARYQTLKTATAAALERR